MINYYQAVNSKLKEPDSTVCKPIRKGCRCYGDVGVQISASDGDQYLMEGIINEMKGSAFIMHARESRIHDCLTGLVAVLHFSTDSVLGT